MIEEKILLLSDRDYLPMEYSRIFLNISNFLNIENKLVIKNDQNENKIQKNKKFNIHQTSFYFEDFLESNNKSKFTKKNNYFQDKFFKFFFTYFSCNFFFWDSYRTCFYE